MLYNFKEIEDGMKNLGKVEKAKKTLTLTEEIRKSQRTERARGLEGIYVIHFDDEGGYDNITTVFEKTKDGAYAALLFMKFHYYDFAIIRDKDFIAVKPMLTKNELCEKYFSQPLDEIIPTKNTSYVKAYIDNYKVKNRDRIEILIDDDYYCYPFDGKSFKKAYRKLVNFYDKEDIYSSMTVYYDGFITYVYPDTVLDFYAELYAINHWYEGEKENCDFLDGEEEN